MRLIISLVIIMILIFQVILLFAQDQSYQGPDDPAGDVAATREAYMDGNRVLLYFQNTTELANWTYTGSKWSRWPNSPQGVRMLDGAALLVGARIYIKNDSIPVTDPVEIAALGSQGELDTLFYLQTSYREEMDLDPTGLIEWGFYPVFGYFNENSEFPAMSNLPHSWPSSGWPAAGNTTKWPGEWNGRFGRGVIYADLETYFVVNDAQDQEYLGLEDVVKYYPRPGVYIGDKRSEVSIQKGKPWGGIGLRVEARGFQFNNEEAQDIIFWEYKLANISEYDVLDLAVGFWVDNGIGGESDDEIGSYDTDIDLFYSWDTDGVGAGGLPTGTMGFAFLETPALASDGTDNDDDGLTDEKRDNSAGNIIGPYDGISDLAKFLKYYKMNEKDLKNHYEGDEDQDWQDGYDKNGNGTYAFYSSLTNKWELEKGEYAADDVGLDGVGPRDLNYNGPDEGECNHKPDYSENMGCEPNFAATDVSEGDMLGLTSTRLFPIPPHRPPYTNWFRNDKSMWNLIGEKQIVDYLGNISNLVMTFSSGPFSFYKGREKSVSIAELHSYDDLDGLNSDEHTAPVLFALKRTAQNIYENDYRFNIETRNSFEIAAGESGVLDDIINSGALLEITAGTDTVVITIFSYNDNPANTTGMERSYITGVGNYIDIIAEGDIVWPAEIKIYYTSEDLTAADINESDLVGIYYWNISDKDWRLYSNSGEDDLDRGTSTTGINTENIQIENREYEGFVWASAYHLTIMRIGTEVDSTLSILPEDLNKTPNKYRLFQNYPNPFNPSTKIQFTLPKTELIKVDVYNSLGQMVTNLVEDKLQAGLHEIEFNASHLPSGVYFYRLQAGEWVDVKKMILLR